MKTSVSPISSLQLLEQVEDLRLDRDVERRHRLVGDDELRLQGDRARDPDALPLAAGELVRIAVVVLGVEPDALHQLAARAPALASLSSHREQAKRLADDRPDRAAAG